MKKIIGLSLLVVLVVTFLFAQWQFNFIASVKANPAYEDFTTYTEVETLDRIQKTAQHVDIDARRNEETYLYKDYTADHFGDFTHDLDATVTATVLYSRLAIWMITDQIDDCLGARPNVNIMFADDLRVLLAEFVIGTEYWSTSITGLSQDTSYYFRIVKSGTSLVLGVYSSAALRDAGDGTDGDVGNTSLTLHTDYTFQYMYAGSSLNTGGLAYTIVAEIENLDLNEAAPQVNSVTLSSPITGTEISLTVNFNFTPTFYQSIVNASVYTNETGTWQLEETNSSAITNATSNVISHTLPSSAEGTVLWNVGVWNSTHEVFASSNETFTLDVPPRYQNVGSNSTSIQENGTILLYGQGYDGVALDYAILSTNESGSWKNCTVLEYVPWTTSWSYVGTGGAATTLTSPSVIEYNDYYYLFAADAATSIKVWNSSNCESWTYMGVALTATQGWESDGVRTPNVLQDGTMFYMLYTGDFGTEKIGLANATESGFPLTWTKYENNPVMEQTEVYEGGYLWDPSFNKFDGVYYMDYSCSYAAEPQNTKGIALANSTDLKTWNKMGRMLEGAGGEVWDSVVRDTPTRITRRNGTYYIMFTGWDGTTICMGLATASVLEPWMVNATTANWTMHPSNPVISDPIHLDDQPAWIDLNDGTYYVYFQDGNGQSFFYFWKTDSAIGVSAYYDSPMDMNDAADSWTWSNFTWQNSSITEGTTIQWKIYYNDTYGNENVTGIHTFGINVVPTNDACTSTANFDVNIYSWVNMTVTDTDGTGNFKEVRINVSASDLKFYVLNWTEATYIFAEVADADGVCTLGTSINETVDSDTWKICFYFKVSASVQKGYCNVTATSTDDSDASDEDLYQDEFQINAYGLLTIDGGYETHTWNVIQGQTDIPVTGDTINFTVTANYQFKIQVQANDTVIHSISLGYTLGVGNVTVNGTESAVVGISLSNSWQDVPGLTAQSMGENIALSLKLWLTVPEDQETANDYVYKLQIQVTQNV